MTGIVVPAELAPSLHKAPSAPMPARLHARLPAGENARKLASYPTNACLRVRQTHVAGDLSASDEVSESRVANRGPRVLLPSLAKPFHASSNLLAALDDEISAPVSRACRPCLGMPANSAGDRQRRMTPIIEGYR